MAGLLDNILSNAPLAAQLTLNPIGGLIDIATKANQARTQPDSTAGMTKTQAAAVAYRKGLMAPQVAQAYEAAVRRGIVHDPYASARLYYRDDALSGRAPGQSAPTDATKGSGDAVVQGAVNGQMWGHEPGVIGALAAGGYGLREGFDALTGKPHDWNPLDMFQAVKDEENARASASLRAHPVATIASTIAGGLTAPGAKAAGDFVSSGPGGASLGARSARSALVGGGVGASAGADNAQDGQKLKAALTGGATGALIGGAAPVLTDLGAQALGSVTQTGARVLNKVTGGQILNPQREAAIRLSQALKADGATPDQMQTIMNEWLRVGGPSPTVMDLASQLPNKGQATLGLLRAAALSSPTARGVASAHADQVAADLQDNAIARTNALTPDTRTVSVVAAALRAARRTNANADYAVPSAAPVDAAPVLDAIGGNAGAKAIGGAMKSADIARDAQAMAELGKINSATAGAPDTASIGGDQIALGPQAKAALQRALGQDPESQTVPVRVGTLNAIKQALFSAGRGAAANPETAGDAPGLFQRANEIDQHLAANNPDYANANANYAAASGRLDALGHGGSILNASPDEFATQLDDIIRRGMAGRQLPNIPQPRALAQVGARQALTDAIGAPAQGSTGALNRIGTATNTGANLSEVFGDQPAADYRQAINNMRLQLQNARSIDPNVNSRTMMSGSDLEQYGLAPKSGPMLKPMHLITTLIAKIRSGATLTEDERQALVQLGTRGWDPAVVPAAPPQAAAPAVNAAPFVPALTYGAGQSQENRP